VVQRLKLLWSAPALDDLDEIAAWIAADSPAAAAKVVQRALAAVERLKKHPASGRRVLELEATRYREVVCPPCRIIYRHEGPTVVIVHVVRSERLLKPDRLF
jgi:plasmid stabilization system protein ParE